LSKTAKSKKDLDEQLDEQLLGSLDALMKMIENTKDVRLIGDAVRFVKVFDTYLNQIRKAVKSLDKIRVDLIKNMRKDVEAVRKNVLDQFSEKNWDVIFENE